MKKSLLASYCAILLASCISSAFAGNELLKNGQTVDQENVKSGDQINAMTVVISNFKEFKKDWDNSAYEHAPQAKLMTHAKVGDTAHLVTFFSNCLPDDNNKCHMSFQLRMFKDNDLVLDTPKTDYELKYPGENSMQMSNMVLGSHFEPKEVGTYTYQMTVTDENADDPVVVITHLTVTTK